MERYRVRAKNTATESENKIHDDEVASRLGFSGGLVPGVDVYAYLCHPPSERWGVAWLEQGTMNARFTTPVYDGDEIEVEATEGSDGHGHEQLQLVLYDSRGERCAEAVAGLGRAEPPGPLLPIADLPPDRPPASPESLGAIQAVGVLGGFEVGFHGGNVGPYLDDIREDLELYRSGAAPHPAWLLRQANYILSRNVRLGPWIHVGSECRHLGIARDGDRIGVRGRVVDLSERKGHRLVDLDVQWVVEGDDPRIVMEARHTAIYQPRGVLSSGTTA